MTVQAPAHRGVPSAQGLSLTEMACNLREPILHLLFNSRPAACGHPPTHLSGH